MDKIPLNSFQILALFFPGVLLAFVSIFCYYSLCIEPGTIVQFFKYFKDYGIGFYFAFICYGIIIGLILDSIRNGILEGIFDRFKRIKWDYFYKGDSERVVMLYARYYNYYVFDLNMIASVLISIFLQVIFVHSSKNIYIVSAQILVIFILMRDAYLLRGDIFRITKNERSN